MKSKLISFLIASMYFTIPLRAQDKFIDSSINSSKRNAEKHAVDGISTKVNQGIDNVFNGSVFKKKNKPGKEKLVYADNESSSPIEKGKTEITITNTTYSSLGIVADALNSNRLVTNVVKTFSNGVGILKVSHSGSSDQLLDDIVKNTGDKFEVGEISEGKITLKMK